MPPANIVPAPSNAMDIVDTIELDASQYTIVDVVGSSVPADLTLTEVAVPIVLGATVTTTLLKWKAWDNYWFTAGRNLDNVFGSLTSWLHGASGPSLDTVRLEIGLRAAVERRHMRQLMARQNGTIIANIATVKGAARATLKLLSSLAHETGVLHNAALHHADGVAANALAHAEADIQRLRADVVQMQNANNVALHQWVSSVVNDPIWRHMTGIQDQINTLERYLPDMITAGATVAATGVVAGTVAKVASLSKTVGQLAQEEEDCGKPICETVGPKTDWGKFFKRFGPKILEALLLALATEDPESVEHAVEKLADLLGPTLSHWAETWVGLTPGNLGPDQGKVTDVVGTYNPLTGG